ncbi:Hpt domain-containing protein [Sphingobacterium sp. SRCM116780]|uniref:Hpt domain-containing protein n=1 Tax=Sphingobacterium sp. SRCM116780 TaxID=2907623 RepID=UPI001F19DD58|nr:Hpt domain-containing protein [Sphingobacterium sp. SRCM116780]UIR56636.1 Hpt domain-containing protein [Sphingobacterium sp. SRCM116780]
MYKHIKSAIIEQNMFSNSDMIKQFVGLYCTQTPLDFEKLEKAVLQQDYKGIGDAAHHIKPTMEYIGASHLRDHLQKIELLAKEMNDINSIQIEFLSLKPQFEELYTELEHYEKSL